MKKEEIELPCIMHLQEELARLLAAKMKPELPCSPTAFLSF